MKKTLLVLALLVLTLAANAIPAKPGLKKTITLADGTQIVATLVGDEHGHFYRGSDGKAYNLATGETYYQEIDAEAVKASAKARRAKANQRRANRLKAPANKIGEYGNYTGKKKGIIILVNFTDTKFTATRSDFDNIANTKNYVSGNYKGSMYDYFYAQSDGKFELTFDVVGPYTVSKASSYYGGNDEDGNDLYPATMVIEALKLADKDVNYADYDWDGDGEVDQVYVVYAGKGEADGGADDTIWPHEWELSAGVQYGDGTGAQTMDGVRINTYACGGEKNGQTGATTGIGTMCHEFSHCLGYPDFYDTDYSGGQGMFEWDLMDSGSYNGDGYRPSGYTGWERWMAGWKTPIELTSTQQINNLKGLQDGGESYIIYNTGNRNEYYMLENRTLSKWDADVPNNGLLIVHVDYDKSVWQNNQPNDDPSHQRMTWVAADNKYQYTTYEGNKYYTTEGAANDVFPYGSVNAFGPKTTPSASWYNTNASGTKLMEQSIQNITLNNDNTISFKFQGLSNVKTPTFTPAAGRYAEAQQVTIACATTGAAIYYTTNGTEPTTSSTKYTGAFTVSETTTVKAVAYYDGEYSAVATAKYTIGAGSQLLYEGMSSSTVTTDSNSELTTSSETLDYDGWSSFTKIYEGANAYAEGGCLKMGSSKVAGSMTANGIALEGNGTLTFYLKKYNNDTGKLNVTVTGATADVTEFTPTDNWTECVVNLTNGTGNVSITLATSSKRAYVDEITLEAGSTSGGGGDTPQPTDEKQFDKVTAVDDGQMCVIAFNVNGTTHLMEAYSGTGTYGYLQASTTATENNGTILASNTKNYFIFEEGSNGFYLRDYAGNFYNSSDGYATFTIVNASASAPKNGMRKAPAAAQEWTVTSDASGNLTIKNNTTGKWLQYNTQYNSVGLYNTQQATGILPGAYAENTTTGISSIENEELENTHTDSAVYTLDGRKVSTLDAPVSTLPKGIYIIGGKKVVVR